MSFGALGLRAELLRVTERQGFEHPTPIQRAAIPLLMQGRDVLATAVIGSGKTAIFLLPILRGAVVLCSHRATELLYGFFLDRKISLDTVSRTVFPNENLSYQRIPPRDCIEEDAGLPGK